MDTIIPPIERKNKILYVLGLFCFILIIVVLLIIFNLARVMPQKQVKTITEVTEKIAETVAPTKKPLNKTEISFEVLNGSGIGGSAANAAKILTSKGYGAITIGNANRISPNTQLFLTEDLTTHQDELIADLRSDFSSATYSGTLSNSTNSARLIIGRQ